MPIFQLDELESRRPWLGWYKIRALMAHPHDADRREEFLAHYIGAQMARCEEAGMQEVNTLLSPLLQKYGGPRALIHTAVSFASFFLTVSFAEPYSTALLGTRSTEMMQD